MTTTKFKPGQSGNPKGRTKNKTPATLFRKSIAEAMPEIIITLIEQAKLGDVQAAKALLDKVCPSLKPQALAITLPVKETLTDQGNEIIKATMGGQIPPDVGAGLITALAAQGKLIELQELAERLSRIEKKLELPSAPK
jgi:hypothetical protein